MSRKQVINLVKLAFTLAAIVFVYGKVIGRDGGEGLAERLADLSPGWILAAACMQLGAIGCAVVRWNLLLKGQGITAPWRHLFGSFMVGRFFGAFTPGGIGLQGYRLYDIATHSGKPARATASIGIEMVLGNLAFAAVVVAGSIYGLRFLGLQGVLLVNAFFLSLITVAIVVIVRPTLVRLVAARLPAAFRQRIQTTVDAVCAYQGRGLLVTKAALLGMGIHAFNNLIYVCAAQALGVNLGVGEVFFASALQIFSTFLPASINGIGLREMTAKALYMQVGVPELTAILIPTVGFAVEMAISSIGGLIFLSRRVGYRVEMQVEHPEHESMVNEQIETAPESSWPKVARGSVIGLCAGLFAGLVIGVGEGLVTLSSGSGTPDYGVLSYGALFYGVVCAALGLGMGLFFAVSGRLMQRQAVPEGHAFGRELALLTVLLALPIGAFRIRRDVFHEELVWKSAQGLMVLVGCVLSAGVVYLLLSLLVGRLASTAAGKRVTTLAGGVGLFALCCATLYGVAALARPEQTALSKLDKAPAPDKAGNIVFIVVDTLRADHLPLWGSDRVKTPNLDAFAQDAVVFDNAFSNASWTRPSFASLLTGRLPSSHQTMSKSASLPDEIVTLPEALSDGGYTTYGVVTNYNVAPFFNFHQGFDRYEYLEPTFVLGANDTAAKLLFVQAARQAIEKFKAKSGQVEPGSTYRDAPTVNRSIAAFLDEGPKAPFFLFAGYMDPHDPYYPHPYDGTGYSRAAHQKPEPDEAEPLRKLYEGEIAFWDEHFGALIADLKRRGLYDSTTIVVTSDHGEEFMDHGGFWHGTTLYDEQVHVPLLVKFPGTGKGSTLSHWVQSVDLMPTLLKGAGLPVPDGVQGSDLAADAGEVFAEESHEGNVLRALRTRNEGVEVKLIEANVGNPRGLAPLELYELDRDPKEQHNVAEELPELRREAMGRLETAARLAAEGKAQAKSVDVEADPGAVERLKALGYGGE